MTKKTVNDYAAEKSLTKRRSRSAISIDHLLVQKRHILAEFLRVEEGQMRALLKEWSLSPQHAATYKPSLCVGMYGLLAYPGSILEPIEDGEGEHLHKTRLLIKVTLNGSIFNLLVIYDGQEIDVQWGSQEYPSEHVREDALAALKRAVKDVTEYEIPKILVKIKTLPV